MVTLHIAVKASPDGYHHGRNMWCVRKMNVKVRNVELFYNKIVVFDVFTL